MAGSPTLRPVAVPPTGPETQAALERKLAASLAAFDGKLKQERERLEQHRAEQRAVATGALEATLDGSEVEREDTNDDETRAVAAAAGNVPDTRPEPARNAAPERPQVSGGTVPESLPDGQDDDIVARQIREAAESETDPGLREKLWEEYRKYKQSSRS
jgi:hypothetical protein